MGRDANVLKERICKSCGGVIYGTAKRIQEHYRLCDRATKINLILVEAMQKP